MAVIFEKPLTQNFGVNTNDEVVPTGPRSESNAGKVVMLSNAEGSGSLFQVSNWPGFFLTKAIFTGIRVLSTTNHQVQHTLGDRVYLNVFGNRASQLNLSGLAFIDNGASASAPNGLTSIFADTSVPDWRLRTGMANVIDYFKNSRLSSQPNPIKVTIDPFTVYECYLHTMSGDMLGAQGAEFRLFQFSFSFVAFEVVFGFNDNTQFLG